MRPETSKTNTCGIAMVWLVLQAVPLPAQEVSVSGSHVATAPAEPAAFARGAEAGVAPEGFPEDNLLCKSTATVPALIQASIERGNRIAHRVAEGLRTNAEAVFGSRLFESLDWQKKTDLIELKYQLQATRERVARTAIGQLAAAFNEAPAAPVTPGERLRLFRAAVAELSRVQVPLTENDARVLQVAFNALTYQTSPDDFHVPDPNVAFVHQDLVALARLFADQGQNTPGPAAEVFRAVGDAQFARRFGPHDTLNVRGLGDSPADADPRIWTRNADFANYEHRGTGVMYRGVWFRPGSVMVVNPNSRADGVFTSFSDPYGTHVGMFVMLRGADGREYPAAIEMAEKGVRAIPLSVFLASKNNSHVEVLHSKDVGDDPEMARRINTYAAAQIGKKGYNFVPKPGEEDPDHCTCVTFVKSVLGQVGARGPEVSPIHRAARANLLRIQWPLTHYETPSDYLNSAFAYQGSVTTDRNPAANMLRELARRQFSCYLMEAQLKRLRFADRWKARAADFAVKHPTSRLAGRVMQAAGFENPENRPRGPGKSMIASINLGRGLEASVDQLESIGLLRYLERNYVRADGRPFSLAEIQRDPIVREMLSRAMEPQFKKQFKGI